jgi:hypothetical protein
VSRAAALERISYYGDSRVRAALATRAFEVVAVHKGAAIVQLDDELMERLVEDGDLAEEHDGVFHATVSSSKCYGCDGKGTMVNPAIDAGGISSRDFQEDPDFAEAYFSGAYDVRCSECGGSGHNQDATIVDERIDRLVRDYLDEAEGYDAERLAEMRMGC